MADTQAIGELHEWLCQGAPPLADGRAIVTAICERLSSAGVPVDMFRLFVFTIHPLSRGRRLQWIRGGGTEIVEADFQLFTTDEYHRNPLPQVIATRQPLRLHLADPHCPNHFKIVEELRASGHTDYLAQPVIFIDGEVHTMSWTTKAQGGFSDADIDALNRIRGPLTRLVESYVLRLNAANIISTYVGRGAGEQVLNGQIKRGDLEEIEAAILFADLKAYTELSNTAEPSQVIDRINAFFGAIGEAVEARGGEILKFMGDGVLAIFPVGRRPNPNGQAKSHSAFEAARNAGICVRAARATLVETAPQAGFRSAIHAGKIFYGNVGASRRLDFTAIGPAVNLAARLLGAAASLGVDDVCSSQVVGAIDGETALAGQVSLKGFSQPLDVHGWK